MAEFKEGQEVEVCLGAYVGPASWRKATIVLAPAYPETKEFYTVRFRGDGSHGFFEADTIRPVRGDDT